MTRLVALLVGAAACAALPFAAQAAEATAEIMGRDGGSIGHATFSEGPAGVLIRVDLRDLPPGFKGMHIHEVGTCADHGDGFKAAKGHAKHGKRKHGLLNPEGPEAGDLPNIYVHVDGTGSAEFFATLVTLGERKGRARLLDKDGAALVIHANPDDHRSQPIGGAGDRVACGVIRGRS